MTQEQKVIRAKVGLVRGEVSDILLPQMQSGCSKPSPTPASRPSPTPDTVCLTTPLMDFWQPRASF